MRRNAQPSEIRPNNRKPDEQKIANVDELTALRRSLLHTSEHLLSVTGSQKDMAAVCREIKVLLRFIHRRSGIVRDLQNNAALIKEQIELALAGHSVDPEQIAEDIAALAKDISIRLVDWHY